MSTLHVDQTVVKSGQSQVVDSDFINFPTHSEHVCMHVQCLHVYACTHTHSLEQFVRFHCTGSDFVLQIWFIESDGKTFTKIIDTESNATCI